MWRDKQYLAKEEGKEGRKEGIGCGAPYLMFLFLVFVFCGAQPPSEHLINLVDSFPALGTRVSNLRTDSYRDERVPRFLFRVRGPTQDRHDKVPSVAYNSSNVGSTVAACHYYHYDRRRCRRCLPEGATPSS